MKFGACPLDEAAGAVLAHTLRVGGTTYKKGRVLSEDDVAALKAGGCDSVIAARLEPDDMGENEAAAAVAAAVAGETLQTSAAFTGRCNLLAAVSGLLVVDKDRIDALNRVDEAVTVSTVAALSPLAPKDLAATVKIIPFAAPRAAVARCVAIAKSGGPPVSVAPFRARTGGLILTTAPWMKDSVLEGTVAATRARLEGLGGDLPEGNVLRCAHETDAVAAAIRRLIEKGAGIVLISGASAIGDRRDVVPAAVEAAGGTVDHFGMPVDPGNLMLFAESGGVPILGLPGSARSPRTHGLDWALQRIFAGLPVGRDEVTAMGVGGLLKEMPGRPLPRAAAVASEPEEDVADETHNIAALVLAAGMSRRMGRVNKLLADVGGTPLVRRVVDAVRASRARPIVVVLGHEADRVAAAVGADDVTFVRNPDYAAGLSTSLKRGLAALPDGADGALVCLGDMPGVAPQHIDALIAAYDKAAGRLICVPTFNGKRGNPVLWDRRFIAEMGEIAGDVGARHLIGAHGELVFEVAMPDSGILVDLDTPAALAAHRAANAG